ncbi:calcium-binding protein [Thalassospira lucentensis]|uniref:Calcium-binding protein n=1 Tax=Thalassospira lucentensis TaxID=168935 RepID=A0A154L8K2_9PROT|nr:MULTISPECIES: hypothetical protein [Thalassospira]KZB66686.1 calcium-binding protein [Thalassospira lucentensis]
MTITIDLSANSSGNGVDLHGVFDDFNANFSLGSGNHGSFFNGALPGGFGGTQYYAADMDSGSSYTGGVLATAGASNFAYDLSTHTITGDLDGFSFGSTLSYDSGAGQYEFTDSSVDISGLGISGSDTNSVLTGIYTGSTTTLESVFDSQGVAINGSTGNDTIGGWAGDDVLTGNGGADTFEFDTSGNFGDDTVTDFTDGTDLLDIDFNSVTVASANGGADTLITHANGTITLTGVDFNDIDATDFV